MPDAVLWLVVADSCHADVYESRNGTSTLRHSLAQGEEAASSPLHGRHGSERRTDFAYELMLFLHKHAEHGDYAGLVIFADAAMLTTLAEFTSWSVSRLLIAEIVDPCPLRGRGEGAVGAAVRGVSINPELTPSRDLSGRNRAVHYATAAAGRCAGEH